MKVTLEFDPVESYEDRLEMNRALNATNAYMALQEIGNVIFRPARKHGYINSKLRDMIEELDGANLTFTGEDLIGELEEMYNNILTTYVNMNDLE